ncbi:MAG TPA: hypothetical protein VGS03_09655 [Candidatus Polarisedimenticolia bacterium]|nr:hypothetical protein [Candidatus Polarisedimenticolia bacterium]
MTTTVTAPIPDRSWTRHLMLAVALLLLLSSVAHGSLGLSTVRAALAQTAAPADVLEIVTFGWLLGSLAQLTFALIVLIAWRRARRGDGSGLEGASLVAAAYFLFGLGAFLATGFQPFYLMMFLLPGCLLGWAVLAARPRSS